MEKLPIPSKIASQFYDANPPANVGKNISDKRKVVDRKLAGTSIRDLPSMPNISNRGDAKGSSAIQRRLRNKRRKGM